jgi:hypothetical protein
MVTQNNARTLSEFKDSINEQVAALQAVCRDFLARQGQTEKNVPHEIRIEIRSSLDDPESRTRVLATAESSMDCWDHTYICGKSTSGYIYCSQKVCMIVGPITVES